MSLEEINQPFLLNVVQNISGIEQLMIYIAEKNGVTENQLRKDVMTSSATTIEQKLTFLRIIGFLRKQKDKLYLSDNLNQRIQEQIAKAKKSRGSNNAKSRQITLIVRSYILQAMANISFDVDSNGNYSFKNQAYTLLVYSYMSDKLSDNMYLKDNQQTVDDIRTYCNNLGYKPVRKTGQQIDHNQKKLINALSILSHLGLAEKIKVKNNSFYYPKFDPYLFYMILRNEFRKIEDTGTVEDSGIAIYDLLMTVGKKYVPMIQNNDPKLAYFISSAIGGTLWILYSRKHIKLLNKGDLPITAHKPSFLEAKFGAKVNWIQKVTHIV